MLELLGLLLKAIITIAIGIIGFTWEPQENHNLNPTNDEKTNMLSQIYFLSAPQQAVFIEASQQQPSSDCATSKTAPVTISFMPEPAEQPPYLAISFSS